MKYLNNFFYFLGNIYFSIVLIAFSAILVIAGTFIESFTGSHRYAASLTYQHPFFILLLYGFFINILISALRRWPFKRRHIPFLMTHFGLLMVFSGIIIKTKYGIQGTMQLFEGTGSQKIALEDSLSLHIQVKNEKEREISLKDLSKGNFKNLPFEILSLNVFPHSEEYYETWLKGPFGHILGFTPLLIDDTNTTYQNPLYSTIEPLSISAITNLHTYFNQHASIAISETASNKKIYEGSLHALIQEGFSFDNSKIYLTIDPEVNFLEVLLKKETGTEEILKIPLQGSNTLLQKNESFISFGKPSIQIDLRIPPSLLIKKEKEGHASIYLIDPYGTIHKQTFLNSQVDRYNIYDEGFLGYTVNYTLPDENSFLNREKKENNLLNSLKKKLLQLNQSKEPLPIPLKYFKKVCKKANLPFIETFFSFLVEWDKSGKWIETAKNSLLFPSAFKQAFQNQSFTKNTLTASSWCSLLFPEIEKELYLGKDLIEILEEKKWPFLVKLKELKDSKEKTSLEETKKILTLLTQQLYYASKELPQSHLNTLSPEVFFTSLMRAYEIHLSNLLHEEENNDKAIESSLILETPIKFHIKTLPSQKKLEENRPALELKIKKDSGIEIVTLPFNRFKQGFKHAIEKNVLIFFQPETATLPYHIRLRNARQINYPNSIQPSSYESDLLITDLKTSLVQEKTLSMNEVYETGDGYRFYLANISPADETTVKQIQLIINYDPAKYFLTYPGAFIISIGILLLFWFRKKS